MKEFLRSVAEHYYHEAEGRSDALGLSDCLFVFPNRRSGLFFAHYLGETSPRPIMAPATTTISEIFGRLSPQLRTTDRMDLLFRLYGLYREMSGSSEEFDNFVFWGDMLLSDFDDLDKYEVNARELFYNVRDIKEIELLYADYDPETVAIIRSFWTHFFPNNQDHKKEVFEQMWSILYDLYDRFRSELAADGLAYEGQLMRTVVDEFAAGRIDEGRLTELLPYRRVVFVGLTAISKVDRHLMLRLKMRGLAEFCWDYADPRLTDPESRAAFFTADNLADFPNALNDDELRAGLVPDAEREVEVLAVPSGVGQAVQAGYVLQHWMDVGLIDPQQRDKEAPTNAIHTAVVLPDEKLLMPMLYAVPKALEPFNVTMGYSLRSTPVAALMDDIIHLQTDTWRDGRSAQDTFYFKPVQALLAHNYICALCGRTASALNERIATESLFRVPASLFADDPLLRAIFRRATDARDAAAYLQSVLALLLQQADAEAPAADDDAPAVEEERSLFADSGEAAAPHTPVFSAVEREFLACYAAAVDRLAQLIAQYQYKFKVSTFFHLLQRLTQGEMVPFSGEPLAGLQLMGVLETRAVDFDNVIILSMNEGVFPAKAVSNTFIPMSLRSAFGMPTQHHRDAVFAYHFYRLCSRARRVTYIYDTRTSGTQTGEVSRYLLQLQHVYGVPMTTHPVRYEIGIHEPQPIVVQKDERIQQRLRRYLGDGTKALSASALKAYCACPLKFYLTYVEDLREDDEVSEGIDGSQFGSVFHDAMSRLYTPWCGRMVTADYLRSLVADRRDITHAVEEAFRAVMNVEHPDGYLGLVSEIIQEFIIQVLQHDITVAPFTYIAAEYQQNCCYPVDDLPVRLTCIYDRIDVDRQGVVRIIDYKTSAPNTDTAQRKTQFNSVQGLFDPDNKACSDEAMQVLMYCAMLRHAAPAELEHLGLTPYLTSPTPHAVSPHLYSVRDFHQDNVSTVLSFQPGKLTPPDEQTLPAGPLTDYAPFAAPFEAALSATLRGIFDAQRPFTQAEDDRACLYCPFRTICGR
jgi:hypothetical protein